MRFGCEKRCLSGLLPPSPSIWVRFHKISSSKDDLNFGMFLHRPRICTSRMDNFYNVFKELFLGTIQHTVYGWNNMRVNNVNNESIFLFFAYCSFMNVTCTLAWVDFKRVHHDSVFMQSYDGASDTTFVWFKSLYQTPTGSCAGCLKCMCYCS